MSKHPSGQAKSHLLSLIILLVAQAGLARGDMPPACAGPPHWTYESMNCRLEYLRTLIGESPTKEVTKRALLRRLESGVGKPLSRCNEATSLGDSETARRLFRFPIRGIIGVRLRANSLNGHRRISDEVRVVIDDVSAGLLESMQDMRDRQYRRVQFGPAEVVYSDTETTSRCVERLEGQFGDTPRLNIRREEFNGFFQLPDPTERAYGFPDHNQSVTLLRDKTVGTTGYARAALTFTSNDDTGLMTSARELGPGQEGAVPGGGLFDRDALFLSSRRITTVKDVEAWGNHGHPGGSQAHGDQFVIAMDNPSGGETRAGLYWFRMDSFEPEYQQTVFLGGGPDDYRISPANTAAVGFIRLHSGSYLMAVGGNRDSTQSIWFYVSEPTGMVSPSTQWTLVDVWDPSRLPGGVCDIEGGEISSDCWAGGSSLALVAGCEGEIFLIGLNGTAQTRFDKEDEFLQVMRVSQDGLKRVVLESLVEQKRKLGLIAIDEYTFRWAGGANVSRDGRLVFLATERHTQKRTNRRVDGWVRIGNW